ncbi:hypothetical protein FPZ12_041420 [Amycolatopsis acidicola]|uniref:Uncharacterized protein n=1 Tax=Amycolatopsis acidicola TaxID=2596893 RepID=A0A5N0UP39_9PSEU|nr:hypothetical protein [Amycolatopsis acidicola]KAA9150305.1 hypothetical protein FPZ12_041420 [Amycolatopsis acidicola]
MLVLTVDASSPSARLDLVATAAGQVRDSARIAQAPGSPKLTDFLDRIPRPDTVAHRFGHDGAAPAIVDDQVREALGAASGPARGPMPESLELLDFLRVRLPDVPHVACPDTAYSHQWHGLSLSWAYRRGALLLSWTGTPNLVLVHLDEDWSVCAAREGGCLNRPGAPEGPVDTEDEFLSRVRQDITEAAQRIGRLDGLVFTGELGWGQPEMASAVCAGLPFLGLRGELSTERAHDAVISPADSTVPVLAVRAREELQLAEIARHTVEGERQVANPKRVRLGEHGGVNH